MTPILEVLQNNAKATVKEIATMTGLSETEVKKKIKNLEKRGVIIGYKTAINWEKAGRESVHALVDVKVTPERGRGYDAIAERIYRFPEVKALYLVSGMYDLSVLVEGKTMKEVAYFVSEKLAPLEQVQGTVTHFLLKKYKENGIILEEKEENKRLAVSP
ncbi:MAG: Lrp/AsnC family transcriptional regulator [Candidatus Hydrothermarchaeales archaeon]